MPPQYESKKSYMRYLLLCLALASYTVTQSQNINDVLRYGLEGTQGTARFQSMGGAFGALGGDFSALNINRRDRRSSTTVF